MYIYAVFMYVLNNYGSLNLVISSILINSSQQFINQSLIDCLKILVLSDLYLTLVLYSPSLQIVKLCYCITGTQQLNTYAGV